MRLHSATQINEKRMTKREGVKGRKKCVCMCVSVCECVYGEEGDEKYEAKEQPQWLTPQAKTGSALVSIALTA